MTKITRVSRLRDCRVFREFTWPTDLSNFGRYNLIYGWNGSGKTTLSRLFRDLELGREPENGEVVLLVDDTDVRVESFPQSIVQIRVFNREFIEENVFPSGREDMSPILVLGAENVEKQKQVERLGERRAAVEMELVIARVNENTADKDLDRFCIDRAGVIKETLRSSGTNPFNNYNKSNFRGDAKDMVQAGDPAVHRLSDVDRERFRIQRQAMPREKVAEVVVALPDFTSIADRVSELLTTTVVTAAIESPRSDHELVEWTRTSLTLHRDRNAEVCQFCEQELPAGRLSALEAHFSTEYGRFIRRIDRQIDELEASSNELSEIRLPNKAELYEDLGPAFQSAQTELIQVKESTQSLLGRAVQALQDKKRLVFETVTPELKVPGANTGAVEGLNAVIRSHNQRCDDFESEVENARQKPGDDMIAASLEEFVRRRGAVNRTQAELKSKEQEVVDLDGEIATLEREIVEHRRPAEELNKDLSSYLGHQELLLEIKETGYAITRGGVPAKSLSEGERTAIALLYFLRNWDRFIRHFSALPFLPTRVCRAGRGRSIRDGNVNTQPVRSLLHTLHLLATAAMNLG